MFKSRQKSGFKSIRSIRQEREDRRQNFKRGGGGSQRRGLNLFPENPNNPDAPLAVKIMLFGIAATIFGLYKIITGDFNKVYIGIAVIGAVISTIFFIRSRK